MAKHLNKNDIREREVRNMNRKWWHDKVAYQIYPKRFLDSNGDGVYESGLVKYLDSNLALIQKIPTPIKPITIDKNSRHITLAYFEQKSTVDYIGVVQGIPVCFDAKECNTDTFPI